MEIKIVFQENALRYQLKKNDIYTYEKQGYFISTYCNDVLILDDFDENYTNKDWLKDLLNGLKGIKYEILNIEL
jgi:hypothetical protein